MSAMYVTSHAQKRFKERMPGKTFEDYIKISWKAFLKGKCAIQYYDTNKELFNKVMNIRNSNQIRVYNNYAFIFAPDKFNKNVTSLVTLYKLI